MFCTRILIFGDIESIVSRFLVLHFPDPFSAVPMKSGPVFIFLHSRTHFRRYRGHQVPFSAISTASGVIFIFCTRRLIFDGTESVVSRFLVLHSRTCFRRYRRCRVSVSFFCTPGLIFDGTEGVGSRFHVLCSHNRFR
jgi:hypothetical protein